MIVSSIGRLLACKRSDRRQRPYAGQPSARLRGATVAVLVVSCRFLLLAVFAVSAATKLHSRAAFRSFALSLSYLRLAPPRWSAALAATTAAAEVAVVAALGVPATTTAGFAAAAGLLVILSAGIIWSLARGVSAPCRCFGASQTPISGAHVGRNVLLLLAALAGVAGAHTGPAPPHPVGTGLGVFFAAVGLLGVLFFDDVVSLFAGPIRPAARRPSDPSTRQGVSS
jgi:hypothetical protein